MFKPLEDRERGLSGSPLSFTKAAYVAALPTLRMEGSLKHHRGCVNHISFSESGAFLLLSLQLWRRSFPVRNCGRVPLVGNA